MQSEQSPFHTLLFRAFHAQRSYLHSCLGESGLGAGQPKLLVYLIDHGPCSQRELADYFEIDPAAVSRMLCAMEKSGFAARQTNQASRRSDLISLTEKGRQFAKLWLEHYREIEEIMLHGFTPQEREQFSQYLLRAYQNYRVWKEGQQCGI